MVFHYLIKGEFGTYFCHLFVFKVRFAHDLRVSEVCRLLRSSRSHYLNVHRPPEVSDVDYIQLQQVNTYVLNLITFFICDMILYCMPCLSTVQVIAFDYEVVSFLSW